MTITPPPRIDGSVRDRILGRTDRTSGCWLWLGCLSADGYGLTGVCGQTVMVHRVAYEVFVGLIPTGMHLDHLCRVRHCVNPSHLEPVSPAENVRRSAPAQKTQCVNGHDYSPENTYARPSSGEGRRDCRVCIRERARRYRQRKAGAA